MSKTDFTPDEAAQVVYEYGRKRMAELTKNLRELRERELKKAIVPPHKHTTGTTTGSGIEDVPAGRVNPPGKNDALKEESSMTEETSGEISPDDLNKEELCKKCGKTHGLEKGCGELDKAMLKDSKGKVKDNGIHPDSVLPEDAESEEVSHDGSGGEIKKGKKMAKSAPLVKGKIPNASDMSSLGGGGTSVNTPYEARMDWTAPSIGEGTCTNCGQNKPLLARQEGTPTYEDAPICEDCTKTMYGNSHPADYGLNSHQRGYVAGLKTQAQQRTVARNTGAIEAAVAGAGPGRVIKSAQPPMAKPPGGKNMGTHVPTSKPATAPVVKEELDKTVLTPEMKVHAMIDGSRQAKPAAAAPLPPSPTPAQHEARAAQFADFTPPAATTGHAIRRPGIFGRLGKSEDLAKAGSVTQPIPARKPAGAGLAAAGAPDSSPASLTAMTATSPSKTAIAPKPSLPRSPVLVPRPAVKPAGAHLPTAGASKDNTEGDKTVRTTTVPARPSAVAPNAITKPSAK